MQPQKISTEALQLFTGDEAFYYRLVPFERELDDVVACYCDEGKTYDAVVEEVAAVYGLRLSLHPMASDETDAAAVLELSTDRCAEAFGE